MSPLTLILSLLSICKGYIFDQVTDSILPHIYIKPLSNGNRIIVFIENDDYLIPPTSYELLCNQTQDMIECYDRERDTAIIGIIKDDYQVLCEGHRKSVAESSCIGIGRNKQGLSQIIQLDIVNDIIQYTFEEILYYNKDIEILWDVKDLMNENALSNIPEIATIYKTIASLAPSMVLSSLKLAAGGDYNGVTQCVDRFHIWSLHLANAFSSQLHEIDINNKLQGIIDDISCIKEATDQHINHQRPSSIKKAKYLCPNTFKQVTFDNNTSINEQYPIYSASKIETLIKDRNHCPAGFHTITACNVHNFGVCGWKSISGQCWNWVCNANKYNDNRACGCNNGCFEQDYYCHCKSRFSVECWGLIHSFINTDSECHSGSTCVTVDSLEDISEVNECMEETFWDDCYANGDPYVWLFPTQPMMGRDVQTDYVEKFEGEDLNDISNNRHCWSMRINNIRAELWDWDWEFDEFEYSWGDIAIGGETKMQGVHVEDDGPRIGLTVERRGW